MKEGWGERRWKRIAKFRLGGGQREGRYWEDEEKRVCRLCGRKEKTWEHVWVRCKTGGKRERGTGRKR